MSNEEEMVLADVDVTKDDLDFSDLNKLSPTQRVIYGLIGDDLEKIKDFSKRAKTAKSRTKAVYYGKKLAKLKGRVINTLRYAESFNKRKEAARQELVDAQPVEEPVKESRIILPGEKEFQFVQKVI